MFAILSERIPDGGVREIASHRLFLNRFGELPLVTSPEIRMERGEDGTLTLCADCFVWKACLDLDGESDLPDNAFDLFPGIPKKLPYSGNALPVISACGNSFIGDGVR